uniref:NADAR domain-containing protein n=1 Tax=Parascaris equorum TaxID=6256 RepID=A0A914R7F4_PAREQ
AIAFKDDEICAVYEKFSQNEVIRRQLFSTENSTMVECSPRDRVWGIGIASNNILLNYHIICRPSFFDLIESCDELLSATKYA